MTTLDEQYADVRGYRVALDRCYDADTHMWVKCLDDDLVSIGIDPLGVETNGTLAQLSLAPAGTAVQRGQALGQLEAAKFVGPLLSPISGTVVAVNDEVLSLPVLVEQEPFGSGWLVQVRPSAAADELPWLLSEAHSIREWFESKVDEYRLKGVIAE